jgi:hypothetical protein
MTGQQTLRRHWQYKPFANLLRTGNRHCRSVQHKRSANAENFNHPERLAGIYAEILTTTGAEIKLPIENAGQLQL